MVIIDKHTTCIIIQPINVIHMAITKQRDQVLIAAHADINDPSIFVLERAQTGWFGSQSVN